MTLRSRWLGLLSLPAVAPAAAQACAVCMVSTPDGSATYLQMSLLMIGLPLTVVGGLVFWLWRRYN